MQDWHIIIQCIPYCSSVLSPCAGGFCPGGSNGELTPILAEMNFWRSSANATELFR